ncbi:MAG: division/cell wall cluster transcriptional repressor MraZ [Bacteroidales bacterium]|nr:division/cell wall cluster transcriptional repressor MraZ [Bacteroidales bacterium]
MLNPYSIKDQQIIRQMTRANVVELDSNDRLMVPPERKSVIGDAKEIVLQSTGECIEIWERKAYDEMNNEIVDFASMVDKRLGELHGLPPASDAE